ncbi:MAG: L-lactate dehydrogenase [Xanthomonadales bacterium]|nr:L-lactate dehydrogenase [Xanthomonadales bacterium]
MTKRNVRPVTASDYRRLARRRLPHFLFDYIDGGANDERTMAANQADFDRVCLQQRVLRDVSQVDTGSVMVGHKVSMPLALSPLGLAGMMARRGEVQAVKAAGRAGVPFTLSTVGICSMQEVAAAASGPFWFQLYMMHDRELVAWLLQQAWSSGCETLVFTVDLAVTGARHRDLRNGMLGHTFAAKLARAGQVARRPHWLVDVALRGRPHSFGNLRNELHDATDLTSYKAYMQSEFDTSVTWQDIAWLRNLWAGKLIIKGVMSADDARAAADVGADGLIVSNHGGRQLDGSSSTIRKLPEVVAAVGQRVEVYLDGGVRSGIDVVKAVCLGARGAFIGRPWIWAVAARGESGLVDLLEIFRKEIAVAMALMGVNTIAELNPELVEWR